LAEPGDGTWPGGTCGRHVRVVTPALLPQETVTRALVYLRLEGAPHGAESGIRRRDRGVHPLVVTAVQAEYRRLDSGQAAGFRGGTVVHDTGTQPRAGYREIEGRAPAPEETH